MHYFRKGCFEFLESMHYCIGILTGYIVNLNFIKSISEKTVLLRDGEKVILSQKENKFYKAFNTYYFADFQTRNLRFICNEKSDFYAWLHK